MTSTRTVPLQSFAVVHGQLPPERLPIPPTPSMPPGQRPPSEVDPGPPPVVGDPVLPGENAPVGDPQPPVSVHSLD